MIDKIFEPFFTTEQGTGTGLRLWITQTIVQKNAGTIVVSVKRGREDYGTSFQVKFPKT